MISEMLVDWLKHAFITKFNHIRPSVYERYTDVLCQDLASGSAFGRHRARKVVQFIFNPFTNLICKFKAYVYRSITIGCSPIGLCITAIGSPLYPFRIPINWPYVFGQLRFRLSLDLDISVSQQCTNYALHDMGSHGCLVLALVFFSYFCRIDSVLTSISH